MSISEVPISKSSTPSDPVHTFPASSKIKGHTFKKQSSSLSGIDMSQFLKSNGNSSQERPTACLKKRRISDVEDSLQEGPTSSLKRRRISDASENRGETREDKMSSQSVFSSSSSSTDPISSDEELEDEQEFSLKRITPDQRRRNDEFRKDLTEITSLVYNLSELERENATNINWPCFLNIELCCIDYKLKEFKDKYSMDLKHCFFKFLQLLRDYVAKKLPISEAHEFRVLSPGEVNELKKKGLLFPFPI